MNFLYIILIIMSSIDVSKAEIFEIDDISKINNYIQDIDKNTLIIFDIHDVIITAKDQILSSEYKKSFAEYKKKFQELYTDDEFDKLWSIISLTRKVTLVDNKIKEIINKLKQANIPIIALTNCRTGRRGYCESVEDLRIKELAKLGIAFNLGKNLEYIFDDIRSNKGVAKFKDGIIFTCGINKAFVLEAFLKNSMLNLNKVLFIDDKKKNLHAVLKVMQKMKINFIGLNYIPAKNIANLKPLNKIRADFQMDVLECKHIWLSDEETELVLNY